MSYSAISGVPCSGSKLQAVFLHQEPHSRAEVPFGVNVFIIGLQGHSDTAPDSWMKPSLFYQPALTGPFTLESRAITNL